MKINLILQGLFLKLIRKEKFYNLIFFYFSFSCSMKDLYLAVIGQIENIHLQKDMMDFNRMLFSGLNEESKVILFKLYNSYI
jgi:hypothetical protein